MVPPDKMYFVGKVLPTWHMLLLSQKLIQFLCWYISAAPIAITHILSSHQGVIVDAPARSLPLNSNVTISCRYKGAPPPTAIVWYRNGTQVGNGADLSLNVNNFRESDIYQCVAFNQHGTGHANHYLCLEDPGNVLPMQSVARYDEGIWRILIIY